MGFARLEGSFCSVFHPIGRKWQRRDEDFAPSSGNALFQKRNLPPERSTFSTRGTALHYKCAEVSELVAFPCASSLKGKNEDQFPCSLNPGLVCHRKPGRRSRGADTFYSSSDQ